MTAMNSGNDKNKASDDFYRELDNKRAHSSCCSFPTLAVFLSIVLLFAIGALFFLYYEVTSNKNIFDFKKPKATIGFENKIAELNKNENISLVLSSDDLSNLLNTGFTIQNFVLKDIRTTINPQNVLIYGNLTSPINSKVVITTTAQVKNNELYLEVIKISAGSLNFPKFVAVRWSDQVTELINKKMILLYATYNVKSVNLDIDKMTINGKRK